MQHHEKIAFQMGSVLLSLRSMELHFLEGERDRVADVHGWKRFGTHILRHSFGVHSTSAGVPIKWVADAMGRTTSTITERHYAKSAQHCIDKAVNSVSGLI